MLQRTGPSSSTAKGTTTRPALTSTGAGGGEDLLSGLLSGSRAAVGKSSAPAPVDASDDVLGDLGKKRKAPRKTFKEHNLLDMKGLFKLYNEMKKLPLSRRPGNEAADMLAISSAYTTWASQLFPPMPSSEVLRRCKEWSGKTLVKNVLSVMRTAEGESEARGPLTAQAYSELTEGARAAAEAEAARRKDKQKLGRGVALDGVSVGSNRQDDEYEDEEAEEVLDFTERARRERGGRGEQEEEEEEEEVEMDFARAHGGGGGRAVTDSQEEFGDFVDPPQPKTATIELEDSEEEAPPPPVQRKRVAAIEEDDF